MAHMKRNLKRICFKNHSLNDIKIALSYGKAFANCCPGTMANAIWLGSLILLIPSALWKSWQSLHYSQWKTGIWSTRQRERPPSRYPQHRFQLHIHWYPYWRYQISQIDPFNVKIVWHGCHCYKPSLSLIFSGKSTSLFHHLLAILYIKFFRVLRVRYFRKIEIFWEYHWWCNSKLTPMRLWNFPVSGHRNYLLHEYEVYVDCQINELYQLSYN